MKTCPYCQASERQIKNGMNPSGTQRYQCWDCERGYTPAPKATGYAEATRQQAVALYVDGMNIRRIARTLQVNHQSVANWVKAQALRLPPAPLPEQVETVELDELFTFVEKKNTAYIMTAVDRATRCIIGVTVVWQRTEAALQNLLDHSLCATHYFSDSFRLYLSGIYAGTHQALPDKSQTYAVEADNAELRHYLARLARHSRCFSRSLDALRQAVDLFVYAWNARQLYKRDYPVTPPMSVISCLS